MKTAYHLYTNFLNVVLFLLIALVPVYADEPFSIPEPLPRDDFDIEKPAATFYNVLKSGLNRLTSETHVRFFDLSRHLKAVSDNKTEAMNIDAFDEVNNSSWYQNRNHKIKMSIHEIDIFIL